VNFGLFIEGKQAQAQAQAQVLLLFFPLRFW